VETDNNKTKENQESVSVGAYLKKAREERHIELDEVEQATKIRVSYLDGLENEEWDKFPSPVYIKGFLRSYAEFLGLSKEIVLDLYNKVSVTEQDQPQKPEKTATLSRKRLLFFVIISFALIGAFVVICQKKSSVSTDADLSKSLETEGLAENLEEVVKEEIVKKEVEREKAEETDVQLSRDVKEDKKGKEEEGERENLSNDEIPVFEEPTIKETVQADKSQLPQFILKAKFNSSTWVAINIDDGPVREYLFQQGEKYQWEAGRFFDLLVGNAAGVNLSLNGKELGGLGAPGEVVRLKLPGE